MRPAEVVERNGLVTGSAEAVNSNLESTSPTPSQWRWQPKGGRAPSMEVRLIRKALRRLLAHPDVDQKTKALLAVEDMLTSAVKEQ